MLSSEGLESGQLWQILRYVLSWPRMKECPLNKFGSGYYYSQVLRKITESVNSPTFMIGQL